VEKELEGHAADRSARSIRHVVNYLPVPHENWWADQGYKAKPGWVRSQDYFENPKFLANFHKLARYGLGFDYMAFPNHMKPMAKLAKANPGVTVYVEHTGMPYDHTPEGLAVWREGMRASRRAECRLQAVGPRQHGAEMDGGSIRPYVLEAIDIFGIDRCMFASILDRRRLQYDARGMEAFFSLAKAFTAEERDKLFAANAIRHYRLAI
jgi:predicted TIM-barrel fold metal-dependent hydrolase